ncbi:MAG: hypothetical protein ACI9NC_005006 [Verrucomicrobiales bacterium]|jgi:hypothetical protein
MILVGEGSLRRAVAQFCEHYHRERNHQGLGNKIIEPTFGLNRAGEGELSREAWRTTALLLLLPGCRMKYRRFEFPDTTGS